MIRIDRDEKARLKRLSEAWNVPQAVIVRVGVDDALTFLARDPKGKETPTSYTDQAAAPKYEGYERKAQLNVYLTRAQVDDLASESRKRDVPYANIVRVGLRHTLDELNSLDPKVNSIPSRYQKQITPDSYAGFATSRAREVETSGNKLTFHLTTEEAARISRLARKFKLPHSVILRVGLETALDELERYHSPGELPSIYRTATFRGTRFRQPRGPIQGTRRHR